MSVGDSEIGLPVTNSRNIKSLARLHMEKTGESYTSALNQVQGLYRESFTFGNGTNEYWNFFQPHLLLSDESQLDAFLQAKNAVKFSRGDSGKSTNEGLITRHNPYSNEFLDDNYVVNRIGMRIRIFRSEYEREGSRIQFMPELALISDLSSLSEESVSTLASLMEEATAFGISIIALSSQPLDAESPLLSAFRVVGSGFGESDIEGVVEKVKLANIAYVMSHAMTMFTEEDEKRGLDFTKYIDQDRFRRIALNRYIKENNETPHWA